MSTIWAPVIAALGASLLTGVFTLGVEWWRDWKAAKVAGRTPFPRLHHTPGAVNRGHAAGTDSPYYDAIQIRCARDSQHDNRTV